MNRIISCLRATRLAVSQCLNDSVVAAGQPRDWWSSPDYLRRNAPRVERIENTVAAV